MGQEADGCMTRVEARRDARRARKDAEKGTSKGFNRLASGESESTRT